MPTELKFVYMDACGSDVARPVRSASPEADHLVPDETALVEIVNSAQKIVRKTTLSKWRPAIRLIHTSSVLLLAGSSPVSLYAQDGTREEPVPVYVSPTNWSPAEHAHIYGNCLTELAAAAAAPSRLSVVDARFEFRTKEVHDLFARWPDLTALVETAIQQLAKRLAPAGKYVLDVTRDPVATREVQLVLLVPTNLPVEDAMRAMAEFEDKWWLEQTPEAHRRLVIDVEYRV